MDIKDLPDEYNSKIIDDGEKQFIDSFNMTPPLKFMRQRLNSLLFDPNFNGTLGKVIENYKREISANIEQSRTLSNISLNGGEKRLKLGNDIERSFGNRFGLEKNEISFGGEIVIPINFREVINKSTFSNERKNILIKYVEDKFSNEISNIKDHTFTPELLELLPNSEKDRSLIKYMSFLRPDFIIEDNNGDIIMIEYKNSKKSQKKAQRINAELFMLFTTNNISSYNIIIGNNYGINSEVLGCGFNRVSERFLSEEGINSKSKLNKFLSNLE